MFTIFLAFFFGAVVALVMVVPLFMTTVERMRRRREPRPPARHFHSFRGVKDVKDDPSLVRACEKQGYLWVLEPEKLPKFNQNAMTKAMKEQHSDKEIIEVSPVKKVAKLKDNLLNLIDSDGSHTTITLSDCTVLAVSASDFSSQKWSKQYPIKLESQSSEIYNGCKTCFIYLASSWEKESWCKALRLAACADKQQLQWFAQLRDEFHHYLACLYAEYPLFLKPSTLTCDTTDKPNRNSGSSLGMRHLLKKFSKRSSIPASECKLDEKSVPDNVPLSSATPDLENKSSIPIFVDAESEKFISQDGTLFWNLLLSRLFFDFKRNPTFNDLVKAFVQRTLSEVQNLGYTGELTCIGVDLGNLPPYISNVRVLPLDMDEKWVVEVDVEYLGGLVFDVETEFEVHENQLQKDMMSTSVDSFSSGVETEEFPSKCEQSDEQKSQVSQPSNLTGWTATYLSRWKNIMYSIAGQVAQVPLSLEIKVMSLRGTLRLQINPPPSDQLWFAFTSLPEIILHTESAIGVQKISTDLALLINNQFKAALYEALVLPDCEFIQIPWLSAESNDWVPRKVAPFLWPDQGTAGFSWHKKANSELEEVASYSIGCNGTRNYSSPGLEGSIELKHVIHESTPESALSNNAQQILFSPLKKYSDNIIEESETPTPGTSWQQETCSPNIVESPSTASDAIMPYEHQRLFEENNRWKRISRRAMMMDLGKKMGEKLEENKRHIEERSKHIVGKMRGKAK